MRNRIKLGPRFHSFVVALLGMAVVFVSVSVAQAQTVHLKWVEAGAGARMSAVTPRNIELSPAKPPQIKRLPVGVTNPLYGVIVIGPKESATHVNVLLDAPSGKPTRLFVDANGDGDFTNDPAPLWGAQSYVGGNGGKYQEYVGGVTIPARYGKTVQQLHLILHRFDTNDPTRSGLNGAITYAPDYAREGNLKLGAKTYPVMLLDALVGGDFRGLPSVGGPAGVFLLIDVNGNGVFDTRGEMYSTGRPFNIGGITYSLKGLTASGDSLQITKSVVKVKEILPPPDLRIGKVAPAFTKKAMNGATIHFPSGYKGKLVLLYFWESTCGDCIQEMPEVVKAYQFFHAQGLEIVGVSLDRENAAAQVTAFTKRMGMPWPEIYDGKWIQSDIAVLYYVTRTPSAFLIDGDTGKVLATGADLGRAKLLKTVATALQSCKHTTKK